MSTVTKRRRRGCGGSGRRLLWTGFLPTDFGQLGLGSGKPDYQLDVAGRLDWIRPGAVRAQLEGAPWHVGRPCGRRVGALAFVQVSQADEDALLGRWVGAAILGLCIGVMVALAEIAFRRRWLEVRFGPHDIDTFTLGRKRINIGSDGRLATVVVAGAAPVALGYWVDEDRVFCEDREAVQSKRLKPAIATHSAG